MTSKAGLTPLPFAGGYYRARSRAFNDKRLINWQVSYPDEPGINDYNLAPCPGVVDIAGLYFGTGGNTFRGAHVMNGRVYAVAGNRLYRIDQVAGEFLAEELTSPPDFIDDAPPVNKVIMASIKNQLLIIVPGVEGYIYTEGGSLVPITDPDFLIPQAVVAIDSYFVLSEFGTNRLFHSNLNDGTAYSALDSYLVSQLNEIVVSDAIYMVNHFCRKVSSHI